MESLPSLWNTPTNSETIDWTWFLLPNQTLTSSSFPNNTFLQLLYNSTSQVSNFSSSSFVYQLWTIVSTFASTIFSPAFLLQHILPYLFQNSIFNAGLAFMCISFVLQQLRNIFWSLIDRLKDHFTYSMTIKSTDTSFKYVKDWLSSQPYSKKARHVNVYASYINGNQYDEDTPSLKINVIPGLGEHFFFFKNHLLWIDRNEQQKADGSRGSVFMNDVETITISTIGFSRRIFEIIMEDAMQSYYEADKNCLAIYTADYCYGEWNRSSGKLPRPMDSVILPLQVKQKVEEDLRRFYENEKWYQRNGIPYRRGYLLYGPPGCGKTSFILALASILKLSVCILNLSSNQLTDENLHKFFNLLPSKSILLLEDIDAAFRKREKVKNQDKGISFSDLLNALDGVASKDGSVVIMTTNHIEQLDPALIRPGRVDLKVEFKLASMQQIEEMFCRLYPSVDNSVAKQIAIKMGDYQLSPAEVLCFCIQQQLDPESALDRIDEYLQFCQQERERIRVYREEKQQKEE